MMALHRRVGELLYGVLFVVIVPAALAAWARALDRRLALPVIHLPQAGGTVAFGGLVLLAAGMGHLTARGGGLPMNAFPPPRFVRSGIFRWVANPIYVGFGCVVSGVALATGSAAGVWVVTPVLALSMLALVVGYERHDLLRRFGDAARVPPRLSLPSAGDAAPARIERVAVALWVLVPSTLLYHAAQSLGGPADPASLALGLERPWPSFPWMALLHASAWVMVPATVLVAATRTALRRFAVAVGLTCLVIVVCWPAVPAVHVVWPLLSADVWGDRARIRGRRGWAVMGMLWPTAIVASALFAAMNDAISIAAALLVYLALRHPGRAWQRLRAGAEWLANSWREWRLGPVRVINHGAYAFAGAFVCILVAGAALGPAHALAVVWVGACIIVGAGLWAQWLEGSPRLLRPFGWYGGMAGALIGAFTARAAGVPLVPLLASFAVAAPWLQILGRLRCLVQGCCHGGPASDTVGIRYRHRRSRVTQLANLAGVPVHPTPLYSILGNVMLGVLMARLRIGGASDTFVLGAYLMLAGIARFVEESFRAEPQTPRVAGLPVYQWFAVTSLVAGMVVSALPSAPRAAGFAAPGSSLVLGALALAALAGFALGVDFPNSNARFSRLAAAD